jgi:Rap1a immunity proteins
MQLKLVLGFLGFLLLSPRLPAQISHVVVGDTTDDWTWETGNDLLDQCSADEKSVVFTQCLGYIRGAVDLIGALQGSVGGDDKKSFWKPTAVCLPNHATSGQITDVVIKYLREHPEERADRAGWIIIRALIKAWGCPASPKK